MTGFASPPRSLTHWRAGHPVDPPIRYRPPRWRRWTRSRPPTRWRVSHPLDQPIGHRPPPSLAPVSTRSTTRSIVVTIRVSTTWPTRWRRGTPRSCILHDLIHTFALLLSSFSPSIQDRLCVYNSI